MVYPYKFICINRGSYMVLRYITKWYTLFWFIRIQFIRTLRVRFGTICLKKREIFAHYKRKVCQMKQQVKRSSLSIHLGVGVIEKLPKIGLEFKNI